MNNLSNIESNIPPPPPPPPDSNQSTLSWLLSFPIAGYNEFYRIFIGGGHIWKEKNFSLAVETMKGIEGDDWLKTTEQLRLQLQESPEKAELLEVCQRRFADSNHYSFHDSILRHLIGDEYQSVELQKQFESIEQAPTTFKEKRITVWTGNAMGASGFNFDPHLYNIPSVLYRLNGVANIRMASPTRKGLTGPTEVIPEMLGYIRGLKKPHLYINLQSLTEGAEKNRTKAIQNLEGEKFCILSLNHDDAFYHQKGVQDEQKLELFKEEFFNFLHSEHCKLIPELKEKEAIQSACQILYPDKTVLSKTERKNCILLTYTLLVLEAIKVTDCESFNITCKDGIDRAAVLNTLLFYLILIFNEKENEEKMQRALFVGLHVPAFLVKSQAVLPTRRDRLILIWELIKSPEVVQRLREFGRKSKDKIDIPENSDQAIESKKRS